MWWMIPNRDNDWKKQEISNLGTEAFNIQYDLQFDSK
jgi:hypothetical protein